MASEHQALLSDARRPVQMASFPVVAPSASGLAVNDAPFQGGAGGYESYEVGICFTLRRRVFFFYPWPGLPLIMLPSFHSGFFAFIFDLFYSIY
jgi:hypothetical protein